MRLLKFVAAAAIAFGTMGALSVPGPEASAEAQRYGDRHWRGDRYRDRHWRGNRGWRGHRGWRGRGHHYGWRNRRVCRTYWRYGERRRVCRWVRYRY